MSSDQLSLLYGAVEEERPLTTPLLSQRTWSLFDTRESALRWAARNRPDIPEGVVGCSPHPRPRQTSTGDFCLVYDVTQGIPRKMVLNKKGGLERIR